MNDFIEKNWFIFVKEKHEGPFTIDDVQNRILKKNIPAEIYVWREGMSDWKLTSALPEFQAVLAQMVQKKDISISVDNTNPGSAGGFVEASALSLNPNAEEVLLPEVGAQKKNETIKEAISTPIVPENVKTEIFDTVSPYVGGSFISRYASPKLLVAYISFIILSAILVRSYLTSPPQEDSSEFKQTYLMTVAGQFPFLERWISTLPALDVAEEEYEELRAAARAKLEFAGPKFALGLLRKDLLFPELILSSNLPDDSKFRVHIIGNSSTLLNRLTFEKEIEIVLRKKLSRTGTIHFQDGKPIPRGEYIVAISASDNQPQSAKTLLTASSLITINLPVEVPKDLKVLAFKTYFLGGPRDEVYLARLKEFHDRLTEKASRELSELKQFSATLENQFDSTVTKFSALREGRFRPKQKKLWSEFHEEWSKLENGLNTLFDNWTPEVIHDQFFYGSLYQLVRQLGQAIDRVHLFQNACFTSTQDFKTLQIQIGASEAAAQGSLILVKSKIEDAEKMPSTANGMPRTEGL